MPPNRRNCVHCGREIQFRQMPYGQWVAFDFGADSAHDCKRPSVRRYSVDKQGFIGNPSSQMDDRKNVFDDLEFLEFSLPIRTTTTSSNPAVNGRQQGMPSLPIGSNDKLKKIPPTKVGRVVCCDGTGAYRTINEALRDAAVGSTVIVKPGTYAESLVLERDVLLEVKGPVGSVVIAPKLGQPVRVKSGAPRICGFSFNANQSAGTVSTPSLEVVGGKPVFEDCLFSSKSGSGVEVSGSSSEPVINRCLVSKSKGSGLVFSLGARGVIKDCQIIGNGGPGLVTRSHAAPTLVDCRVADGSMDGVLVKEGARVALDKCDVVGNGGPGISVLKGGKSEIRECRINRNIGPGVWANEAAVLIENSDLLGNSQGSVVLVGACSIVRSNNKE